MSKTYTIRKGDRIKAISSVDRSITIGTTYTSQFDYIEVPADTHVTLIETGARQYISRFEVVAERRPHYDLIVAWANGEEIQVKTLTSQKWEDITNPCFLKYAQYRIKPNSDDLKKRIAELEQSLLENCNESFKLSNEIAKLKEEL